MKKMVEWSRFEKLEKKYSKLCQKQNKIENKLAIFKKMPQAVINGITKEGLYLKRAVSGSNYRTGTIYLKSTRIRKNHCDVCNKRRKTTGHHIIPTRLTRLNPINRELSQLKIRVCSECESKIHPENKYAESFILNKKEKEVRVLQGKLNKKVKNLRNVIISIFDKRLAELGQEGTGFIWELKKAGHQKKIYPAIRQFNGRLKELRYLKSLVSIAITDYFNKYKEVI